ncbi:MAG: acyltransferase [Candidatus Binatia bacterium]
MLRFLPAWFLGSLSLVLLAVNTIFWCIPLYAAGLAKLISPFERWRQAWSRVLMWLAAGWIDCNSALLDVVHEIEWDVRGIDGLRRDGSYLVSCNHQTWADIPILQRTFNRKIPFLKFFLKQELIRVPLLGLAWWFLDFPFMKRYSRATLERRPELRGKDLETTRRMCRKFRNSPVSILNFVEGTRFTAAKHAQQRSPYRHLLRPKAGGMAFALDAMGGALRSLLDVTIVYPDGAPNFWDFLAGRLHRVIVRIKEKPIPADLLGGDYLGDDSARARFQQWIQSVWEEKDTEIDRLLRDLAAPWSCRSRSAGGSGLR